MGRRIEVIESAAVGLALALVLAAGPARPADDGVGLILQGAEEAIAEGRFAEAAEALDGLADRAAKRPRFHALRARAAAALGRKTKAADAWYRLLALTTTDPAARAGGAAYVKDALDALPGLDPSAKDLLRREKAWARRLASVAARAAPKNPAASPGAGPGDVFPEAVSLALLLDPESAAIRKLLDRSRGSPGTIHFDLREPQDCARFLRAFQTNVSAAYDRKRRALRFHAEPGKDGLVAQHRRATYGASFQARLVFRCDPPPQRVAVAVFHLDARRDVLGPQMGYVHLPLLGEKLLVSPGRLQTRGTTGRWGGPRPAAGPSSGSALIARDVKPDLSRSVTIAFICAGGRIRGLLDGRAIFDEPAPAGLAERCAASRVTIRLDSVLAVMTRAWGGFGRRLAEPTDWLLEEVFVGPPPLLSTATRPAARPKARDAQLAETLARAARRELDRRRPAKAAPLAGKAVENDRGRADLRLLLAEAQYRAGRRPDALATLAACRRELGPWLTEADDARLRAARALIDPAARELEKIRGEALAGYGSSRAGAAEGGGLEAFLRARARAFGGLQEGAPQGVATP